MAEKREEEMEAARGVFHQRKADQLGQNHNCGAAGEQISKVCAPRYAGIVIADSYTENNYR